MWKSRKLLKFHVFKGFCFIMSQKKVEKWKIEFSSFLKKAVFSILVLEFEYFTDDTIKLP